MERCSGEQSFELVENERRRDSYFEPANGTSMTVTPDAQGIAYRKNSYRKLFVFCQQDNKHNII